jgi:DNA-directed RNA polymerase specialized sigma24 family protein
VDQELVARARRGDRKAYEQISRSLIGDLDGAARLILGSGQRARDAVTVTLVGGWRDLPRLPDPTQFEPWLRRRFVVACLARVQRTTGAVIDDHVGDARAWPAESKTTGEDERVRGALLSLEPEPRSLIVLREYLGLSVEGAAAAVGIDGQAARTKLDRAREALRGRSTGPQSRPGAPLRPVAEAGGLFGFRLRAREGGSVPYLDDVLRQIGRTRQGRVSRLPAIPGSIDAGSAVRSPAMLVVVLVAAVSIVAVPALLGGRPRTGPVAAPVTTPPSVQASAPTPDEAVEPQVAVVCDPTIRHLDFDDLDLTGAWAGDDDGIYYIRQAGNIIWWTGLSNRSGEPQDLGREWSNVGRGVIKDDVIEVSWADVPRGDILGNGTLSLKIEPLYSGETFQLRKIAETGEGFGNTIWTPCLPG